MVIPINLLRANMQNLKLSNSVKQEMKNDLLEFLSHQKL